MKLLCVLLLVLLCSACDESPIVAPELSTGPVLIRDAIGHHFCCVHTDYYVLVTESDDTHQITQLVFMGTADPPVWKGLHCIIHYRPTASEKGFHPGSLARVTSVERLPQ